ncbi:hypothetical protein MCEMRE26_00150 [Candidatus Nanopelagicaceae bacterium]
MKTGRIIQILTGAIGALVAVFVCALAGIDFSAQEETSATTQQNVLIGQSQTSISSPFSEVTQLRSQIQQLKVQLSNCKSQNSFLEMDALTNQMAQQRR